MTRSRIVLGGLVLLATGVLAGFVTATAQQEPNYLVIETYEVPSDRPFADAQEEMMDVVRTHRSTGAYKSVRLFMHAWGPELAFYLVEEPNDWGSILAGFGAQMEAQPDMMNRPFRWASHSDNILTEILVN